jgi:hypothetical protein
MLKVNNPDIIKRIKHTRIKQPLELDTKPAEDDLHYWMLTAKLSGDNGKGVINSEDMILEELVRSMPLPIRTVEEQQSSANPEQWETTDDSGDDELKVTNYWEASKMVGDYRRQISQTLRDLILRLKSEDPNLRP